MSCDLRSREVEAPSCRDVTRTEAADRLGGPRHDRTVASGQGGSPPVNGAAAIKHRPDARSAVPHQARSERFGGVCIGYGDKPGHNGGGRAWTVGLFLQTPSLPYAYAAQPGRW